MRHKAEKLMAKVCSGWSWKGCIELIMHAFEDVAVNFAWEMLQGYHKSTVTIDQLKSGWRDYALPRPFRPDYRSLRDYPSYKTDAEIVKDRMSKYYCGIDPYKTQAEIAKDKMSKYPTHRYYKCLYCDHCFLDVGNNYCPRCGTKDLCHITPAGYNKERQNFQNQQAKLLKTRYTCSVCGHTYLGRNHCPRCYYPRRYYKCCHCNHTFLDAGPQHCPRCNTTHLESLNEAMYKKEREKFLNTYGYVARPGLDLEPKSLREQGFYTAQDVYERSQREKGPTVKDVKDYGLPVGYISYEDMEYLWECMPEWIRIAPGGGKSTSPLFYGTGTWEGDLEAHNRIRRILRRI